MSKKELQLVEAFNKFSGSIDFLKGAQEGAKNYDSVRPNYYAKLIEAVVKDFTNLKDKFFAILAEEEEEHAE